MVDVGAILFQFMIHGRVVSGFEESEISSSTNSNNNSNNSNKNNRSSSSSNNNNKQSAQDESSLLLSSFGLNPLEQEEGYEVEDGFIERLFLEIQSQLKQDVERSEESFNNFSIPSSSSSSSSSGGNQK